MLARSKCISTMHFYYLTHLHLEGLEMSHRSHVTGSWLDHVAGLLSKNKNARPKPFTRRLVGERLERRTVLSVAPVELEAVAGPSLAEYLAQDHEMGPIAPVIAAMAVDGMNESLMAATLDPGVADQVFGVYQGEGLGEGEGSGSGSGTNEPPIVTENHATEPNGTITVEGTITDDGAPGDLSGTITGGTGTLTINSDGTFVITDGVPDENGRITITITDADGGSTTYTIFI